MIGNQPQITIRTLGICPATVPKIHMEMSAVEQSVLVEGGKGRNNLTLPACMDSVRFKYQRKQRTGHKKRSWGSGPVRESSAFTVTGAAMEPRTWFFARKPGLGCKTASVLLIANNHPLHRKYGSHSYVLLMQALTENSFIRQSLQTDGFQQFKRGACKPHRTKERLH